MVQPAASAGITLQAIWLTGQFHGVIKPHTPIGSRPSSSVSELPSMAVDALLLCGRVSFCYGPEARFSLTSMTGSRLFAGA
jgi:hypothetical protein